MKHPLWSAIYDILIEVEALRDQAKSVVAVGGKRSGGVRKLARGIQADDIIQLRAAMRGKLDFLKIKLNETLNEREVYLVLFPLVIYFDEIMQSNILHAKPIDWPPLQKELYHVDNGGELFYEALDDILRKPETLPFVYEIFYFCLSDGFRGRYVDNPVKIDEYKRKLAAKIPMPPQASAIDDSEDISGMLRTVRFPFWYYGVTILFLLSAYLLLSILAN